MLNMLRRGCCMMEANTEQQDRNKKRQNLALLPRYYRVITLKDSKVDIRRNVVSPA